MLCYLMAGFPDLFLRNQQRRWDPQTIRCKRNQSVNTPLRYICQLLSFVSNESNSNAIHKPNERTVLFWDEKSNDLNNSSFSLHGLNHLSSSNTCIAAIPAAQQNRVTAKRGDMTQYRVFRKCIHPFLSAMKAPNGIPPPNALPSNNTSGSISKCSKPQSIPVRAKTCLASSSTNSVPVLVQRSRRACIHSISGGLIPASAWTVSAITQAVCCDFFSDSNGLYSECSTSGSSGR